MADKVPIRAGLSGASLTGLAIFASGETIGVAHGGTGVVTIGSNALVTGNGTSAMTSESNLTFDGSTLATTAFTATGNVSLDGGAFVFNESGADKDFRIEGDTATNLFIADASTDRIGIGTATPSHLLDVDGVANVATCLITPKICVPTAGFNSGYTLPGADGSAGQIMCTDGSGALAFATAAGVTLVGSTDNTIATVTGANALAGEANLTFDGTNLIQANGSGYVLGYTAKITSYGSTPEWQQHGTASNDSRALMGKWIADESGPRMILLKSRSATIGTRAIVSDDDTLGELYFYGDDGDADSPGALIKGAVDGTPGDGDMPGRLTFLTTPDGSASPTEKMRIDSAGLVGIGTAAPATLLHAEGSTGYMKFDPAVGGSTELKLTSNSGGTNFGTYNGSALNLYTDSAERMRIDTSGRVGIGTASMSQKLDVRDDSNGLAVVTICNAATCGRGFQMDVGCGNPSHYIMSIKNNPGTALLQFTGDGLLGIGTAAPGAGLHIENSTHASLIVGHSSSYYTLFQYNGNINVIDGTDTNCFRVQFDGCTAFHVAPGGNTMVCGSLSKGSGSFRIDHPLESRDGHDLVHSFIEGPQADLIYRGVTQLVDGSAEINVDTEAGMTEGTFVVLNRCTQVFTTNESNWDAVRGSITGNMLTIESNIATSAACISWMVVGERQDQHMYDTNWTDESGKVIVEPEKTEEG